MGMWRGIGGGRSSSSIGVLFVRSIRGIDN
jgi:hypothetical protein